MRRGRRVLSGVAGALLALAALASAAAPQGGKFRGTTSQLYPDGTRGTVTIKLTHHGQRLRSFDITWLAPCDNGFTTLSQGTHAQGTVNAHGGFHGGGSYFSDRGNLAGTQYTATITDRLQGRFVARRRVRGTFQATAVLKDAGGQQVSICTSPTIPWQARHR